MTSPAASPARQPVRDFTRPVEPITFTCDGETYKAPRTINSVNITKMLAAVQSINLDDHQYLMEHFDEVTPVIASVLQALIPGKGGDHLATRVLAPMLGEDEYEADPTLVRPLDLLGQAIPIMIYVIEELGLRPTTPPSPSLDGSTAATTDIPSDGTSSTDGLSLTASGLPN